MSKDFWTKYNSFWDRLGNIYMILFFGAILISGVIVIINVIIALFN